MAILGHPVGFQVGDAVIPGIVGFLIAPARGKGTLVADIVTFAAAQGTLNIQKSTSGSIVTYVSLVGSIVTNEED